MVTKKKKKKKKSKWTLLFTFNMNHHDMQLHSLIKLFAHSALKAVKPSDAL
ncbi:hypothetical protein HanIR_Chr15g0785651 [Helianthus annuus]|nr:hypothetical protein HanIR_Chr15g0785651 [Helianthus annuus]